LQSFHFFADGFLPQSPLSFAATSLVRKFVNRAHFQQILAWTLKSRWQQPRTLSGLREITGTFCSEK
jgi:hypothetical protein